MNPYTLIVRADADPEIGTGHVMRCLALAQAWQEQGGAVLFHCQDRLEGTLQRRLRDEQIDVTLHSCHPGSREDVQSLLRVAFEAAARFVVIDGYHFDAAYQKAIVDVGLRLLVMDDNGDAAHFYADLVLNQNAHAAESLYVSREQHTELLLGTEFVLLRREFWAWRALQREIPLVAREILVTMGGSDFHNVTQEVLEAIARIPDAPELRINVVVGGANPHFAALAERVDILASTVHLFHDVPDMPRLMATADLAVTAGGSTVWELCMMGVPMVIHVTASNQELIANRLASEGAGINLDPLTATSSSDLAKTIEILLGDPAARKRLHDNARRLVDGYGAARVVSRLREA